MSFDLLHLLDSSFGCGLLTFFLCFEQPADNCTLFVRLLD